MRSSVTHNIFRVAKISEYILKDEFKHVESHRWFRERNEQETFRESVHSDHPDIIFQQLTYVIRSSYTQVTAFRKQEGDSMVSCLSSASYEGLFYDNVSAVAFLVLGQ